MCGLLRHALGWWGTTTGAYALKAVAIGLPLLWVGFAGHALSGFVGGRRVWRPLLGYLMQLIGPAHQKNVGLCYAAFALLQATAGYLMAFIYAQTGSYRSLFCAGLCGAGAGRDTGCVFSLKTSSRKDCISASSYCFYLDG
ncbi:hypothetical protein J4711_13760 [Staphylococcus epidermidis]|nr:hypothetical protein [Staphylococcus epidermidis]